MSISVIEVNNFFLTLNKNRERGAPKVDIYQRTNGLVIFFK